MKKILLLFCVFVISFVSKSQCELNATASSFDLVCGQSASLSAFGYSSGLLVLDEDFNSGGFGPGWSSTPGATNFSNPCSPGGADGTPHAWMDASTSVPRTLTSATYDLTAATAGVTVCFDLLFAEQGDASPCEGPDEPDEGVFLQYSINGVDWITIHYFDPNGGSDPTLTSWNNYCFDLPLAAITATTQIRWHQTADSGASYDHWGIDNVQIFQNDINSEIEWLHDGYSYGVGSGGGVNPNLVTPTTTTSYTAQITTGTGDVCTQTITINVVPPTFEVDINATPTTICAGDCSDITATAIEIISPASTPTFENNEFSLVATGSASINVNVQGLNTTSIFDGFITEAFINGFNFSGTFFCTNFGGCPCGAGTVSFGSTCSIDASAFTVTLTAPGGCASIVLAPPGAATDDYSGTVFVPGGTAIGGTFPTGGPWAPSESFSDLNGCDPNGVWTLTFNAPGLGIGIGTLTGWGISFDDPAITGPVDFVWSPTTAMTNSTTLTPTVCPTTTTTYELTVSNSTPGCDSYTEPITITVDPCGGCVPPTINILPLETCAPGSVDLTSAIGAGSDAATLTYHATELNAQNDVSPIATIVSTTGSYWVRAEDPSDATCFLVYEIVVTINPLDDASFSVSNYCEGDPNSATITGLAGGTFSFNPLPGDGATINPTTGAITGGVGGNTYTVQYTTTGICPNSSTQDVTVNICTSCLITNFDVTVGACEPSGNYTLSGFVEFTDAPATGQLIVEDCNGNQQVFDAPFTSPTNFSFSAGTANGLACNVSATFTDDVSCTQDMDYTAPACPCNMDALDIAIGPCDVPTNTFSVNGTVEFSFATTTGQLIVEDCNGNQVTFNAPFTSPQAFTISGIAADGTIGCNITAYFTDNPTCEITSSDFDYPNDCSCPADIGTFTSNLVGDGTTDFILCDGDQFIYSSNGDYIVPNDQLSATVTYDPGIAYLIYSCPPNYFIEPNTDPCLLGLYSATDDMFDINDAASILNAYPPGTFTDNTVYFVPITMYSIVDLFYSVVTGTGGSCYNLGPAIPVQYLTPITSSIVEDCQAGTATITVSGALPAQIPGELFTASGLTPATASFDNTTTGNGGTITISGLIGGDNYSFTITDANGCPHVINGGPFTPLEDATFNYGSPSYCTTEGATSPIITGTPGGTFTSTPAGLTINAATGQITPSTSTEGTYDITYTTPGAICFNSSTVTVTIAPTPTIDPVIDQNICLGEDFTTITFTGSLGATFDWVNSNPTIGLAANGTGDITSFTSTGIGTGNITVTPSVGACVGTATNFDLIVNPLETADFNYPALSYCTSDANPTANITGTPGGTFTSTPAGLTLNALTGEITLSTSAEGNYDITYTSPGVCSNNQTVGVSIISNPIVNPILDQTICLDENFLAINFTGSVGATFDWTNSNPAIGLAAAGTGNISAFTSLGVGTATITVTPSVGTCSGTPQTFDLTVNPLPTVNAGTDQTICIGELLTLVADNPTGAVITWNNGVVDNVPFSPVSTNNYLVTANLNGCIVTDEVIVTVNPLPNINAGNNLTICEGNNVTLTATGGVTYIWDNAVVNNTSFTPPNGATVYTVVGTDANGCENTDQVTVTVNPNPVVNFMADTLIGCEPLVVNFTNLTSVVGNNCLWDFGNGNTAIGCGTVTNIYQYEGNYDVSLTVTDNNGCTGTTTYSQYIQVNATPTASFYASDYDLTVEDTHVEFTNTSVNATTYLWTFGHNSPSSTTENPIHSFPNEGNGNYVVTLVAYNGVCTDTAQRTIRVSDVILFYVPNVFTPDGDQFNEVFQPVFTSGFDPYDFHLMIFNRWGELVFESHDASKGWNGTYGGVGDLCQDGVYVWKIDFKETMSDKRHEHYGHVSLLK